MVWVSGIIPQIMEEYLEHPIDFVSNIDFPCHPDRYPCSYPWLGSFDLSHGTLMVLYLIMPNCQL